MAKKTKPANRSEGEIAGYRDALATIHSSHKHMPVKPGIIRQLHRDLYRLTSSPGGEWKPADNEIIERRADGTTVVRFRCVPAAVTPEWVEGLCTAFNRLRDVEAVDALLLVPAFILDFLCIHPFRDGNGRIARLLTLLLLYQAGYEVGRYISIERIIEDTKETYYESLNASSRRWHEGKHDLSPWRDYFLGVLLAAYRECEERAGLVTGARGSKQALVIGAIEHGPMEFAIKDLERVCPGVSRDMIRHVLRHLQKQKRVECLGTGRNARWVRRG
jgi:Fic family protein